MPVDATLNGEGFRYYRWSPIDGGEPTDVLSVTSIRRLCGESFNLVNWQIANVIDVVLGTQKRTKVGPRGGVSETRQVWEYPSEFVRRYAECANDDPDSDVLASQPKIDDLRKWLRDTADAPRNIAAVRGTLVHEAIEKGVAWDRVERAYVENAVLGLTTRDRKRMKDVSDEDVDFIRNGVRQYWDFRRKVPMRILAQEVQVWNLTHGYAGTVDALVWLLGTFVDGEFVPLRPENIERAKALKSEAVLATDIAEIGGTIALLDWKTSSGVYCVEETSLVLTDDLRWVQAGELKPGDGLWAFTEDRVAGGRGGRRWERSVVTHNEITHAECITIHMESGRKIVCTPDHPLLARRASGGRHMTEGGTIWVKANDLRVGDTLPYYVEPWFTDQSREAGWFAGLLDGEGCLSGRRLSFAQKEGVVAQRARQFMRENGIEWRETDNGSAIQFAIRGDASKIARILGSVRPSRLIPKFSPQDFQAPKARRDRVVGVEMTKTGTRRIASLTTTSHTYISDGYGSHNTDQVVQAHAYMSAEFVGAGGVVDNRLTTILEAAFLGGLVHIRPNGWGLHMFPYSEDVVRAFLGSVAFARMLARYPEPTEIFTVNIKGQSEEVDDAVGG